MEFPSRSTLTRLLTVLLSTVAPMTRGHAESGKVAAVNQDATGTPPGGAARTLVVGTGVVYKEKIETSVQGSIQILFPDQSTLNLGRNSSVVLDEYVYDPKVGTGTMAASLQRGVMRFIGGQISHTAGIRVETPVSSLAIRGGAATVVYPLTQEYTAGDPSLAGAHGAFVIGHVGIIILKNRVGSVTIRPGFGAWVGGSDEPIQPPFRISDLVMAKVVAALTSGRGQNGGGGHGSPQAFILRDGVGSVILNNPAHPPGSDPLGFTSIFGGGNDIARSKSQSNQTRNTSPPPYGAH